MSLTLFCKDNYFVISAQVFIKKTGRATAAANISSSRKASFPRHSTCFAISFRALHHSKFGEIAHKLRRICRPNSARLHHKFAEFANQNRRIYFPVYHKSGLSRKSVWIGMQFCNSELLLSYLYGIDTVSIEEIKWEVLLDLLVQRLYSPKKAVYP